MTASAIAAEGVVRTFGAVRALDGLSFELEPGELYGLVGPDGAGKTTAIRVIAGLMAPQGGSVRVFGFDPMRSRTLREQLGLLPQEHSLYRDLTVGENLEFFSKLFCLPRNVYRERVERLLRITRLTKFVGRRAAALSGGMYKKLALACALLHEPRLLLLDEPTNGVDPVSRRELWELLYELVDGGMTVLVSTPYMDEAERCFRVGLLHHGRLIAEGTPADLVRDLRHETYEVVGGARLELQRIVDGLPLVISSSPAGERLRVVVVPAGGDALAAAVAPHGGRLERTAPSFEDLFMARVSEKAAA